MTNWFTVEIARSLVLRSALTLILAAIIALSAPLLAEGRWTLSSFFAFVPVGLGIALILMLAAWVYDTSTRYALFRVRVWPWITAAAALLAGAAFLSEIPLAKALRPWIPRQDLRSIIFAVSSVVLAFAVAYSFNYSRRATIHSWRSELKADLRSAGAFGAGFIALFMAHAAWLGSIEQFSKAIERDAGASLAEMVLGTVAPLLVIGALVGYCLNAALAVPVARHFAILNNNPDIIQAHEYDWFDYAPRRPFRTVQEERLAKTLPIMAVFVLSGLLVGSVLWPQQWVGSALGCACLGLLASFGRVGVIHWSYRHADLAGPSAALIGRRAFIRQQAEQLQFVVMEDDGSPSGRIQVQLPWSEVQEFSKDSYNGVFGLSHVRPFKSDWNVVKLVPTNGAPLLVSETLEGDAELYANTSRLTDLFGPKAREEFLRGRSEGVPHSPARDDIPSEL